MARRARVVFEGAIYHVTFRGNRKAALFRDDRDRERFLEGLAERVGRYGVRVYLYVLMRNHVHVVLETPQANLPEFMGSLLTSLAVSSNRRYGDVGHVTQGRYKAPLVEGDEYLLRLTRYVHQNPVWVKAVAARPLAERVAALRAYRWSSYRAYAGLAPTEPWVSYGPVLAATPGAARVKPETRYRRYVESGLAETDDEFVALLRDATLAIGSTAFVEAARDRQVDANQRLKREDVAFRRVARPLAVDSILDAVCRYFKVERDALRRRGLNDQIRPAAAVLLVEFGGLTQRETAPLLGLSTGAAICLQLKRLRQATHAPARDAVVALRREFSI